MNNEKKDLAYYLALPYKIEIAPIAEDDGGGYNACIPVLGRWSAVGDGDTPEEAITNLRAALPSLIEGWLKDGVKIPEPEATLPSGKLVVRLPRTLHARVTDLASANGVSVNTFIVSAVAIAVGESANAA